MSKMGLKTTKQEMLGSMDRAIEWLSMTCYFGEKTGVESEAGEALSAMSQFVAACRESESDILSASDLNAYYRSQSS